MLLFGFTTLDIRQRQWFQMEAFFSIRKVSCNLNNPVVIFHSQLIASLTPECIHLGNPSSGRIDSPVNYGYLFT